MTDETTDPTLRSFVAVERESHFPIQNLPWGVFAGGQGEQRVATRIGDTVVDVSALAAAGVLPDAVAGAVREGPLNRLAAAGREAWTALRSSVSRLLREDAPRLRDDADLRGRALVPADGVRMALPFRVGDYTDFYSSREHATNVGVMFRGRENALMPNWLHLPVAYHGRASSVVPSGTPVRRPRGQTRPDDGAPPVFGPSRLLDFELEMGFFTGPGNEMGSAIAVGEARDRILGLVLVNDWSARDVQKWEYQPLGPFNAKNFATSISPWVVTLDALEPFRVAGPAQDPEPLPYLRQDEDGAYDIRLEVWIGPGGGDPVRVSVSNFRHLYWSMAQQLAHHTVGGCNVRPGDLMASGTISAPSEDGYGSLLELTWKGTRPIPLPGGGEMRFLRDGDRVTITGWAQAEGHRIGFGEVTGEVLPAPG